MTDHWHGHNGTNQPADLAHHVHYFCWPRKTYWSWTWLRVRFI